MNPLTIERHIDVAINSSNVIDTLKSSCPELSSAQLKLALHNGAVWLGQGKKVTRIRRAKKPLKLGQMLHLYYNEKMLNESVEPAKLIADEADYSVWHKPCGMFSQGTKWGDHSSICRWVETVGFKNRPTFLVHRLDRATQGLIIVAHTKKATQLLTKLFENRQIEKHYKAEVFGEFPTTLVNEVISEPVDDKPAKTKVLSCKFNEEHNISHLKLKLETGRKHQIRRHLASKGFPIIGDRLYGEEENQETLPDLKLTSCYLAFDCPITGKHRRYFC